MKLFHKPLVPSFLFILIFLCSFGYRLAFGGEYYVDPNYGKDAGTGSLFDPWKTFKNSINKLKAGDTLYLRKGTYFEKGIYITIKGTPDKRITVKNYPGESVEIDGGYREFRTAPNTSWEVYDSSKDIYVSVNTYPSAKIVYGFFDSDNGNFRLVPYRSYGDLSSGNEDYTDTGYMYLGPGIFWNSADAKIYIRLKPSQQEILMGYTIPSNTDPRTVKMNLLSEGQLICLTNGASYLDFDGIDFKYSAYLFDMKTGTHDVSIKNSRMLAGSYYLLVRDGVYNLVLDGINITDTIPPWITWSDVKIGRTPGSRLKVTPLAIEDGCHDIEIKNCSFNKTFDGIDMTGASYNIHIHHNTFFGLRDDAIQLGSGNYDVEIDNNVMKYVFAGISWHGSLTPVKKGTKYIHHNIVDTSKPQLGGRKDPSDLLDSQWHGENNDGMVVHRPFGRHTGSGFGEGDPWKIYNNTAVFGDDLYNGGAGHAYPLSTYNPSYPHEVYNNIFVQIGDQWLTRNARVADGSEKHDGNIYFRSYQNPKTSFFQEWQSDADIRNFASLAAFKTSSFFSDSRKYYSPGWENSGIEADPQLNSEYRPSPQGVAASGALSLPTNWPGRDGGKYRGALPPSGDPIPEPEPGTTMVDRSVAGGSDDAEENSKGTVSLSSSDLELVNDGSTMQVVGMRFQNLGIPAGATIVHTTLEFVVDETSSALTSLQIEGELQVDAGVFVAASENISSRSRTQSKVLWQPEAWSVIGEKKLIPDLTTVVQEMVNQQGWTESSPMVFIISGSGSRVAESYEGAQGHQNLELSPRLHIEFEVP